MTRAFRFSFILLTLLGLLAEMASRPALAAFSAPAASTIAWFYAAAFGRSPLPNSILPNYGDITGLTFWTDVYLDGGAGFEQFQGNVNAIADFFVASDEFEVKYPASLTNEQFVTALYENMLGRSPELAGLDYWVSRLDVGDSRGTVLANFVNTPENQDSNPIRKYRLHCGGCEWRGHTDQGGSMASGESGPGWGGGGWRGESCGDSHGAVWTARMARTATICSWVRC